MFISYGENFETKTQLFEKSCTKNFLVIREGWPCWSSLLKEFTNIGA
jgi:hypothetical protein